VFLLSQTIIYLALALIAGGAIGYAWRACLADTACDSVREDLVLANARYEEVLQRYKTQQAQKVAAPVTLDEPKMGLADLSVRDLETALLMASPGAALNARFGGDDLTQISGITSPMDVWLGQNGVTRFSHIAELTAAELYWLVENLPEDGASVYRDQWVAQATMLDAAKS
jgi:predicted flap endonuclease-1-like 5' DNA nuclease